MELNIQCSPALGYWLQQEKISLAFTTYQTNRLVLLGSYEDGRVTLQERLFDKPMGLYLGNQTLYMSTRYQIWTLENRLAPQETYQDSDRLYVPSAAYTTGNVNVHDVALDKEGKLIFVNTDFSCLAQLESGYSFKPLWYPPFISKLVAEDRCHLNGLAMVAGEPVYMSACSATDEGAGWRNCRHDGGVLLHLPSNDIILQGLSMPHSPRFYQDKLWILNSGSGELGYIEGDKFCPIVFCSAFVRGLAFWKNYALVGLSKLRSGVFGGLVLEERLRLMGQSALCGLMVVDISTGKIAHSLTFENTIEELFDVAVLPGVVRPKLLGLQNEDIERLVCFPGSKGLMITRPTVKRPSLGPKPPIAGLPEPNADVRGTIVEAEEASWDQPPQPLNRAIKFQRVYHLNPESLAPYDGIMFPSLQDRWQHQPPQGEIIGVSAALYGDLIAFVIAERLPNGTAEIISLFVEPSHRHQGIATRLVSVLEKDCETAGVKAIRVCYPPSRWTTMALEPLLKKRGWTVPQWQDAQTKICAKHFFLSSQDAQLTEKIALGELQSRSDASEQIEASKQAAQQGNWPQVVAHCQAILNQIPNHLPTLNQLGTAYQNLNQPEKAMACYQQALASNPQLAASYSQALVLNPHLAVTHYNLGILWQNQGELLAALRAYEQAIEFNPGLVEVYHKLGSLYTQLQDDSYRGSFANPPIPLAERIILLTNLAAGYLELGFYDQAQTYFAILEPLLLQPGINLQAKEAAKLQNYLLFSLPYLRDNPTANSRLSFLIGKAYSQHCIATVTSPAAAPCLPTAVGSPLRIGVISKHFRRHSVGWCSRGILQGWAQLTPYLFLYVTDAAPSDDLTEEFRGMAAQFTDLSSYTLEIVLAKLRADRLDVLIDMDSLMNFQHPLLLHHRPARVVVSWLGCEPPFISEHNYYLCDRNTHPEGSQLYYQERLLYMSDTGVAIEDFPVFPLDSPQSLRQSLKIAPETIVYLSVAPRKKLTPDLVKAQVEIIKRVPQGILLHKGYSRPDIPTKLYQAACEQAGVDPQRCRWVKRQKQEEEHRTYYAIADVGLDTYPYNGGTHNLEFLWFNVPLVTRCGEQAVARFGYAFLQNLGIAEGVAYSWDEYIQWGVRYGTDAALRCRVRDRLQQSKGEEYRATLWHPQRFAQESYQRFQGLVNPGQDSGTIVTWGENSHTPTQSSGSKSGDDLDTLSGPNPRKDPPNFQVNSQIKAQLKTLFQQAKQRVAIQDYPGAIGCYKEALQLVPDYGPTYSNLGSLYQLQGKFAEAKSAFQRALQLQPTLFVAYQNLAGLYSNEHCYEEALQVWQEAFLQFPQSALLQVAIADLYRQMGNNAAATQAYREAIRLDPNNSSAYQNLGGLLMSVNNLAGAKFCFKKALDLNPHVSGIYRNLAEIYEAEGDFIQALNCFNYALTLEPDNLHALYQKEHLQLTLCQWDNYDRRMTDLLERVQRYIQKPENPGLPSLTLNCFPASPALHRDFNRHWARGIQARMAQSKCCFRFTYLQKTPKLRIGYLSADFRNHAVGSLIRDLFSFHSRDRFEVYAYSLGNTTDETTEEIKSGCDFYETIATLSVEESAQKIHSDGIHILIDLCGYTAYCRPEVLALGPAPLQLHYLGYPDTLGADFIPYLLTDRYLIPPELKHYYTEALVELPHFFVTSPLDFTEPPPQRSVLGLPEDAFVYACFNRTDKWSPDLFNLWLSILQAVPNAVLWLPEVSMEVCQTLRQKAQSTGVEPDRLIFLSKRPLLEFISLCRQVDLCLDTFLYNGGATSICALQAGVPLLTCPGTNFAARMGASICHAAHLESFICESAEIYREQAIYWGTHSKELRQFTAQWLQQRSQLPLFQPALWVKALEDRLLELWQSFVSSSPIA